MKQIVQVTEVEGEGLLALMGQRVTFTINDGFYYTGKLVGVNDTFVKLENPAVVYETGDFQSKQWKDAQPLPNDLYIMTRQICTFCVLK